MLWPSHRRQVLQQTAGIHDLGGINWLMLAALAVAWLVIGASLIRGVASLGKASSAGCC